MIRDIITSSWLYWGLTAAYLITILTIVGVVLSENRNPLKSLAWVTVLLLFPIGGVILYIFFGRSIKNKRMISRRNRHRLQQSFPKIEAQATERSLRPTLRSEVELCKTLCNSHLLPHNHVDVYATGEKKFQALIADIMQARLYINLQYYIFEDDSLGNRIKTALIERAKAGVKVRIIYDHIGSLKVKRKFFKEMTEAGIEAYPFFKVAFPPFATRINWRNHRKMAIIDGHIGYIGGMNVAERYITGGKRFAKWRDTHLRIQGPAVAALQYSFAVDWNFMGRPLLEDELHFQPYTDADAVSMQLLTSGPTSEWSNIALAMLKAIGSAKQRIYIQTPYFLPPESMLKALEMAALARVDVRVMIPRRSDSRILTHASNSFILECLRAGIKIYLFDAGMLHSKTMIVDDQLSFVGSANIDFRSFEHNFESTMVIYGKSVNSTLCKIFESDQTRSERLAAAQWRERPMSTKAKDSIARLLSPIL